jgi:hypothetical protein
MTLDEYTPEQWAQMKLWVDTWRKAGPELERIREEEVRNSDTQASIKAFSGMIHLVNQTHPPEPTSGLVEQQRWFMKFARQQGLIK